MTKGKMIVAKVFVGIICAILMLGTLFMALVFVAVSKPPNNPNDYYELTPTYENLPNVMGDDGVYVSKNFFVENSFTVPTFVNFGSVGYYESNYVYISGRGSYNGRAKELEYHFTSYSLDNNEGETKYITVHCDPKNISELQNKQKYNGYTYGVRSEEKIDQLDGIMTTHFYYTVNFNRNENTTKKCQLKMIVTVKRSKDIASAEYKEACDKLFYSMLDNVVYRNI